MAELSSYKESQERSKELTMFISEKRELGVEEENEICLQIPDSTCVEQETDSHSGSICERTSITGKEVKEARVLV